MDNGAYVLSVKAIVVVVGYGVDKIHFIPRVVFQRDMNCTTVWHTWYACTARCHDEWTRCVSLSRHFSVSRWVCWLKKPLKLIIKLTTVPFSAEYGSGIRFSGCVWESTLIPVDLCAGSSMNERTHGMEKRHFNFVTCVDLRSFYFVYLWIYLLSVSLHLPLSLCLFLPSSSATLQYLSPTTHGQQENLFEQSVIVCRAVFAGA